MSQWTSSVINSSFSPVRHLFEFFFWFWFARLNPTSRSEDRDGRTDTSENIKSYTSPAPMKTKRASDHLQLFLTGSGQICEQHLLRLSSAHVWTHCTRTQHNKNSVDLCSICWSCYSTARFILWFYGNFLRLFVIWSPSTANLLNNPSVQKKRVRAQLS